jgi:hypothetical protein
MDLYVSLQRTVSLILDDQNIVVTYMHAIVTIKYDFHCLKMIIVLCFHYSVI